MKALAAVTRNNYIESIHYGYACVVDADGNVLYHAGDYNTSIFFRSSAKPIQVLPLVKSGAADAFKFSLADIAIACASHSGQKKHQLKVGEILNLINLNESSLHCGTMVPYNEEESKRLISEKQQPTVFHCSCSGKHAAMLALAKYRGYALDEYERFSHPIQQEILEAIVYMTGVDGSSIRRGVDGCGAPIYTLSIHQIALAYARLTAYSQEPGHPWYKACKTVFEAMTEHPDMVSGDYEFCTELMEAAGGKLIGKVGCEAVYCVGAKAGNLGICIKIVDGNERAVYPVVIQLLKDFDILNEDEITRLERWFKLSLKNNLGEEIGEVRSVLSIHEPQGEAITLGARIY